MKVTLPLGHIITQEFTAAITALCRAKGLDVKKAWPLAAVKRQAAEQAKQFEIAREDSLARHGLTLLGNGVVALTDPAGKTQAELWKARTAYDAELRKIISEPFTFSDKTPDAGSVTIDEAALTGDVLEQVMEFVKRPEPT